MLFGGASGKGIHYHTAYSIAIFFIKIERRGKDPKEQTQIQTAATKQGFR